MKEKYLFDDEEVYVYTNGSNNVSLTNLRIRSIERIWGKFRMTSILLENVSSAEIRHRSNPIFVIISIIAFLIGIQFFEEYRYDGIANTLFGTSVVFLFIFLLTRKRSIVVSSNGGSKLTILTSGMGKEQALEFVNKVELAVRYRNEELGSKSS